MLLAEMALEDGDTTAAAEHWTNVRDLWGNDVLARRRYARFLLHTGRSREAEEELRAVLVVEPHWVDARRELAEAVDAQGESRRADAVQAYESWLARAPREPADRRAAVEARLATLRGR